MIATVNPYSSSTNNHHFKITDVTNEYNENDENYCEQEGSLVEYCRIDKRENEKNQPDVCYAMSVMQSPYNNNVINFSNHFARTVSSFVVAHLAF